MLPRERGRIWTNRIQICCSLMFLLYRHVEHIPSGNGNRKSPFIDNFPLTWANYNISLTWIKAIWGWFPLLTMIPVRSQWGRYNLPRLTLACPGFLSQPRLMTPKGFPAIAGCTSRRSFVFIQVHFQVSLQLVARRTRSRCFHTSYGVEWKRKDWINNSFHQFPTWLSRFGFRLRVVFTRPCSWTSLQWASSQPGNEKNLS